MRHLTITVELIVNDEPYEFMRPLTGETVEDLSAKQRGKVEREVRRGILTGIHDRMVAMGFDVEAVNIARQVWTEDSDATE